MPIKVNRRRAAVGALSVAAAVAALAAGVLPAEAAAKPKFLTAAELPQGKAYGPWTAHAVKPGVAKPQYTCIKGVLPGKRTTHRTFTSDLSGEARELITVAENTAAAKELVADLKRSISTCATKIGEDTTWKSYGKYGTEDGLAIYGVFFAPPGSEYHLQMFGVGRDGKRVVVTALGQMGRKSEAPVTRFTTTAKTALKKAF